jgi:CheY-like chemotaxis protein
MFCRTLQRIAPPDWRVTQASSGEAALRLIDNGETFDVIFMDHYMASHHKQLLGTEAIQALRSRNVHSIICGLSANDKEEEFMEAGADAFMLKRKDIYSRNA